MNQPKVFEFAKELGLPTLELMDKLREWKIPIKSHMAELDTDMVALIRSKLSPSEAGERRTVKKKVAAPKKKEVAPVGIEAKTAVADGGPKKVIRRKVTATETAKDSDQNLASDESDSELSHPESSAMSDEHEKKSVEETAEAQAFESNEDRSSETREVKSLKDPKRDIVKEKTVEAVVSPMTSQTPAIGTTITHTESATHSAPTMTVAEVTHAAPVPTPAVVATPAPVPQEPHRVSTRPPLKREVVVQQLPPGPRTRGNIVGRMDLSRATPPPRQSGGYGGGGGYQGNRGPGGPGGPGAGPRQAQGANPGFGAGPRPKGNIRTGFFQVGPDPLPPPEVGRSRFEDRSKKRTLAKGPTTPGAVAGPAAGLVEGAAKEEVVESFLGSEYRKREIIFQPKKKTNMLTREALQTQITTPKASKRVVKVNKNITVTELARQLKIKAPQIISHLMKNGMTVSMNDNLDFDTATLVSSEFGFEAENTFKTADEMIKQSQNDISSELEAGTEPRPPVVTVMGHVDHGKTSLLDAIRNADVAAGEAGGITQHIGAYRVTLEDGARITFIDTPGHEAFTAMRARGANVTDVAIIVVAGDDGVMPQTAEAINHAKTAGVPIIVAVNKMDKPGVNPDRIKQQLTEFELVPEEWGGTTIYCPVSALKKTGIKELLEQIKLVAEMADLRANPKRPAAGVVIESRMEKGRGVVATVLVKDGTLRVGQAIVAGSCWGKVKAMLDEKSKPLKEAGPSVPVEVLGFTEVPLAGDRFGVCEDETMAKSIATARRAEVTQAPKSLSSKMSLEDLFSKVQAGDVKELGVVLKTDVAGSNEAVKAQLEKLSTAEVKVRVLHAAVGGVTESDVLLASTAKGIIIGFNVRPDSGAASLASREGVEIKSYSIIYELIDDVKKAMSGLLAPEIKEVVHGRAEVRNIFNVPKVGTIAGCSVQDGKIIRSGMGRLLREGRIVYEGKISSLKRFKDDAKEVAAGFECGIGIENYNDLKVGDVIEAFEKQVIARSI